MKRVSATEFSRRLSEYLDRVDYYGEEFSVVRNDRDVAKVSPTPKGRTALEVMTPLFGILGDAAGRTWLADSRRRGRRRRKEYVILTCSQLG